MHKGIKQIISLILVAIISLSLLLSAFLTSAAQTVLFEVTSTTAQKGDTANISISLSEIENAVCIGFAVVFDEEKLQYVTNSGVCNISSISNSSEPPEIFLHGNNSGKVIFQWIGDTENGYTVNGNILSLQFTVLGEVGEEAPISVLVTDLAKFPVNGSYTTLASTVVNGSVSVTERDSAVVNTENLISAIGIVSFDDASKAKIDAAQSAYGALNSAQKLKVSNYSVLAEAQTAYYELSVAALRADLLKKAENWKTENKKIISLTVETVTLDDKTAVEATISSLNEQPIGVQTLLNSEKNHLMCLQNQIVKLEKIKEDEDAAKELEAAEFAEALEESQRFRKKHAVVLNRDLNTVLIEDLGNIEAAIAQYNDYALIMPKAQEILAPEKKLIDELYNKVMEMIAAIDPDEAEIVGDVSAWRIEYLSLLSLDTDSVTADDIVELKIALAAMNFLSAKAQKRLTSEKELLEGLLIAAESLAEEPENGVKEDIIDDEQSATVETVTKTEIKYKNKVKNAISYLKQNFGITVWILLGLLLVSVILLVIYYIIDRKVTNCAFRRYSLE